MIDFNFCSISTFKVKYLDTTVLYFEQKYKIIHLFKVIKLIGLLSIEYLKKYVTVCVSSLFNKILFLQLAIKVSTLYLFSVFLYKEAIVCVEIIFIFLNSLHLSNQVSSWYGPSKDTTSWNSSIIVITCFSLFGFLF